jgi:perosamine synthetase
MYTIQFSNKRTRDTIQKNLTKAGIMTKVYFSPVHLTTFYKEKFKFRKGSLPVTEEVSEKVLTLPLYPSLTIKEMDYILDTINNCCG